MAAPPLTRHDPQAPPVSRPRGCENDACEVPLPPGPAEPNRLAQTSLSHSSAFRRLTSLYLSPRLPSPQTKRSPAASAQRIFLAPIDSLLRRAHHRQALYLSVPLFSLFALVCWLPLRHWHPISVLALLLPVFRLFLSTDRLQPPWRLREHYSYAPCMPILRLGRTDLPIQPRARCTQAASLFASSSS